MDLEGLEEFLRGDLGADFKEGESIEVEIFSAVFIFDEVIFIEGIVMGLRGLEVSDISDKV